MQIETIKDNETKDLGTNTVTEISEITPLKLNPGTSGDKYRYLDSLRGVAAMVVVFQHFGAAFLPYAVFGGAEYRHSGYENIFFLPPFSLLFSAHFAVCLFFILSGFVLSHKMLSSRSRISPLASAIKRPVRLYGVLACTIGLSYLLSHYGLFFNKEAAGISYSSWLTLWWQNPVSFSTFAHDLILSPFSQGVNYAPPLWTIELELYGALLVFGYLLIGPHPVIKGISIIIATGIFLKTHYLGFVLGIACAEGVRYLKEHQRSLPGYLMWGLLFLGLFLGAKPNYLSRESLLNTPYAFLVWHPKSPVAGLDMLAAFFLFVAVLNLRPIQKLLESSLLCYLGKISYSLYAVHFLIMGSVGCMIFVEARIYLDHLTAVIIAFAGSMLVLVPLAHVMHENVDLLFISLAGKFGKYIDSRRWLRDLLREPSVIKSPAVNPVFINSLTINESNITQNKAA